MNNLSLIAIIILISSLSCVQKINYNDNLYSLVEAERSFAKASVENGIRDAFLAYLADFR